MQLAVTDREFGEMSARLAAVERGLDKIANKVDEGNAATDAILIKLSRVEGGWKVLAGVAAASAAIGGLAAKFLPLGMILPK